MEADHHVGVVVGRPFADVIARADVGPDTPHVEIGRRLRGNTDPTHRRRHRRRAPARRRHACALGVALDLLEDRPVLMLAGFRSERATRRRHSSSSAGIRVSSRSRSARSPTTASGRWPLRSIVSSAPTSSRVCCTDRAAIPSSRRSSSAPPMPICRGRSPTRSASVCAPSATPQRESPMSLQSQRPASPTPSSPTSNLDQDCKNSSAAEIVVDDHADIRSGTRSSGRCSAATSRRPTAKSSTRVSPSDWRTNPRRRRARSRITGSTQPIARKRHAGPTSQPNRPRQNGATRPDDLYEIALLDPPVDEIVRAELLERAAIASMWTRPQPSVAMMRANEADRLYRSAGVPWRAAAMWLNPGMRSLPKPKIDTSSLEGDSVAAVLAASEQACRAHSYREAAELARDAARLRDRSRRRGVGARGRMATRAGGRAGRVRILHTPTPAHGPTRQ